MKKESKWERGRNRQRQGDMYIYRERKTEIGREAGRRERERQKQGVKQVKEIETDRQRNEKGERETDRQTDKQTERDRGQEIIFFIVAFKLKHKS